MVIANRKQCLFVGASFDFDEKLRKFVVTAQLEDSLEVGRNTNKFCSVFELFAKSGLAQGLTKMSPAFILRGSLIVAS